MSNIKKGTVTQRLDRIEIMMCNHLHQHKVVTYWLLGILSSLVIAFICDLAPKFIKIFYS